MATEKLHEGIAFLVGAGPGDPGLLTIRGLRCLQEAQVALYDDLASDMVLSHLPEDCERIYVGKRSGFKAFEQEEINALLVEKVQAGRRVVRLKGGDPFVFGRGGEEALALMAAGERFEIVPGISSSLAAPAYAGIPVTHRDVASAFTVVTGHEDPDKASSELNWDALAKVGGTIVVLMGVGNRGDIARRLMKGGRPADTPVAAVRWGTRSSQRTVRGTLGGLAELPIESPSAIVIGGVAGMNLAWFERRPLLGLKVAVTRTRQQASRLLVALTDLGAEALEIPTVEIRDPADWVSVDAAIDVLGTYDWVVFSSPNGVERFLSRLMETGRDARCFQGARIGAIGPATVEKLSSYGLRADLQPRRHKGEGLAEAFLGEGSVEGLRFLLPKPEEGREELSGALRSAGALVEEVVVYRTVKPERLADGILDQIDDVDMVTFTSSSTADHFADLLGDRLAAVRQRVEAVSIGPTTTQTARDLGFNVVAEAAESNITIDGLLDALVSYVARKREPATSANVENAG